MGVAVELEFGGEFDGLLAAVTLLGRFAPHSMLCQRPIRLRGRGPALRFTHGNGA